MIDPFKEWRDGVALRGNPYYAPASELTDRPSHPRKIAKPCGKCRDYSSGVCMDRASPSYGCRVKARKPCPNNRWKAA